MREQESELLFDERDRTVDVNVTEMGVCDRIRYYTGTEIPTGSKSHASVPITIRVQKRKPTGGKAIPEREKPFINSKFFRREVAGSFLQPGDSTYDVWQGVISGVYAVGSFGDAIQSLDCGLTYPMRNGGHSKALYFSDGEARPNPDILSQAEVKCYNKFGDKVGDPGLQPGLWYGERRETAHLLQQGAHGVLTLASAIARKDYSASAQVLRDIFRVAATPKGERARVRRLERWLRKEGRNALPVAKRTLSSVENAVLTYNLGISPLISDLTAAHQRLVTGDLTHYAEKTGFKAIARHSVPFQGEETLTNRNGVSCTTTVAGFKGYTVTMKARPVDTDLARLSRLGLTSPISLAYQLTGLTFLIDYFVALGPWLDALNVPMGYTFIEGSYGLRNVQNITVTVKSPGGKVAKGWSAFDHFERKVYGSFPFPIPPLSLRGRDLSVKQATNASLIAIKKTKGLLGLR